MLMAPYSSPVKSFSFCIQFGFVSFPSSQFVFTQTFALKMGISKMKRGFELLWEVLIVNPFMEHGRVPNTTPMKATAIILSSCIIS